MNLVRWTSVIRLLSMSVFRGGHGWRWMGLWCDVGYNSTEYLGHFDSETIRFATKNTYNQCDVTFSARDGYGLFVDASRMTSMCPLVTFYLDGVKVIDATESTVACTDMPGVAAASVVRITADYIRPTGVYLESITLTTFYKIKTEECASSNEEECCQKKARVVRTLAMCDTNRCIDAVFVCDDVVHCEHGGDEAVWCRLWAWWVWVVGAVVGLAVVGVVILTVVVIVKKTRKTF